MEMARWNYVARLLAFVLLLPSFLAMGDLGWAQPKPEKSKFTAVVMDSQGVETELKHLIFYWEERISETAFVPHELAYIPARHGNTTLNIKFEKIKQIDVKPGADKTPPSLTITLTSGKTGEFLLAVNGTLKGETDFGEVELPVSGLKKVVLR